MKSYILGMILVMFLITSVAAEPITYKDEYYTLGNSVNEFFGHDYGFTPALLISADANVATARELRRQTILLEKQNELIAEQNHIMWVQACYVPHDAMGGEWFIT